MMPAKFAQTNLNPPGGVPKQRGACWNGAARGDKQHRRFHGGPLRAVCVYSPKLIEQLRAQGHPISPGSTGENRTLCALNWSELKPGLRLQTGQT